MKNLMTTAAAVALTTTAAAAGGIERSSQSVGILFEKGTYAELSFGRIDPSVSGTQLLTAAATSVAGAQSGNMASIYSSPALGFKTSLNDQMDVAITIDEPIGANVYYPAGTGYLYGGSQATIDSTQVTALLRYKLPSNVSVYGGLKVLSTEGNVGLFNGYTMSTKTDTSAGYVVGVAYEKPEIAMRVALTYSSAITHDFQATEGSPLLPVGGVPTLFETEVPQSLNLEFQSGIAKDTLLFGSIRWVDWSEFDITPTIYQLSTGSSLVSYENDTITYNLGVGRKFNDTWSGAVTVGYEKEQGGFSGNLGPTDGNLSLGLAATYTRDSMKITGGVRYVKIGDAQTEAPGALTVSGGGPYPDGSAFGDFKDNHALAAGIKVGFYF